VSTFGKTDHIFAVEGEKENKKNNPFLDVSASMQHFWCLSALKNIF